MKTISLTNNNTKKGGASKNRCTAIVDGKIDIILLSQLLLLLLLQQYLQQRLQQQLAQVFP